MTINEVGTDDDGDLFIEYSLESYDGGEESYRDSFEVNAVTMITYPTREIISIVKDGQSA